MTNLELLEPGSWLVVMCPSSLDNCTGIAGPLDLFTGNSTKNWTSISVPSGPARSTEGFEPPNPTCEPTGTGTHGFRGSLLGRHECRSAHRIRGSLGASGPSGRCSVPLPGVGRITPAPRNLQRSLQGRLNPKDQAIGSLEWILRMRRCVPRGTINSIIFVERNER